MPPLPVRQGDPAQLQLAALGGVAGLGGQAGAGRVISVSAGRVDILQSAAVLCSRAQHPGERSRPLQSNAKSQCQYAAPAGLWNVKHWLQAALGQYSGKLAELGQI